MSYSPAANEYTLGSVVTAGFPAATAVYIRCVINRLVPGVNAELTAQLLDVNGTCFPVTASRCSDGWFR